MGEDDEIVCFEVDAVLFVVEKSVPRSLNMNFAPLEIKP